MGEVLQPLILIAALFALLATGLWVAVSIIAVAIIGMVLFSNQSVGDSMALTMWGAIASWPLTPLPLFIWMGEILFRSRISSEMFAGLAPWVNRLPGRLLHVNVLGCTIFAAVSGSSVATMATMGRISIPELTKRNYPEHLIVGTLTGAGTLGLMIPPSIVMIVYGVAAQVSISQLFLAGVLPGLMIAALFTGYVCVWSLLHQGRIPKADLDMSWRKKLRALTNLLPAAALIVMVLGSIYSGIATATEAAAIGVAGGLVISAVQGTLNRAVFVETLRGAVTTSAMVVFILAAAAFLSLSMGFSGLPADIARWVAHLELTQLQLILILLLIYVLLGCFLDGISIILLTISILMPTLQATGIDLIWFGIFVVITVEMAQITPPVGFNLFVMQSISRKDIYYISKASLPFFSILLVSIFILIAAPQVATILPATVFAR